MATSHEGTHCMGGESPMEPLTPQEKEELRLRIVMSIGQEARERAQDT